MYQGDLQAGLDRECLGIKAMLSAGRTERNNMTIKEKSKRIE